MTPSNRDNVRVSLPRIDPFTMEVRHVFEPLIPMVAVSLAERRRFA